MRLQTCIVKGENNSKKCDLRNTEKCTFESAILFEQSCNNIYSMQEFEELIKIHEENNEFNFTTRLTQENLADLYRREVMLFEDGR